MNILFDINHPAHVHLFKNAIKILENEGHNVIITSRDKDMTIQLLNMLDLKHVILSRPQKGLFRLGLELIWRQLRLFPILIKNKIQICVSVTGACNVHACWLLNIPTLVFYDTEHASLQNKLTLPFVTFFFSPDSFKNNFGKKHIKYNGTHDLAYLHPAYFHPDQDIYRLLGINPEEKFVILRFVSWAAAHDIGQKGIPLDLKRKIIACCAAQMKVFISSETPLDKEFEQYRFPVSPEMMHDALYFATMFIGEGGSMATEAAVLGTPSIFISSLTAGVFDELEKKHELMFSFTPDQETAVLNKIQYLLETQNLKSIWREKKDAFINQKIDLTALIVQEIKNAVDKGKNDKNY